MNQFIIYTTKNMSTFLQSHSSATFCCTRKTITGGVTALRNPVVDTVDCFGRRRCFLVHKTSEAVFVWCCMAVMHFAHKVSRIALFPYCKALELFDWKTREDKNYSSKSVTAVAVYRDHKYDKWMCYIIRNL